MNSSARGIYFSFVLAALLSFTVTAFGQMLDTEDPCNGEPEPPPQILTCGQHCGWEIKLINGESQLVPKCQDSPISDRGWENCKVETNAQGLQECSVGERIPPCQIT